MKLQLNKNSENALPQVPIDIENWIEQFPYNGLIEPFYLIFRCGEKNERGEYRRLRVSIDLTDWIKQ